MEIDTLKEYLGLLAKAVTDGGANAEIQEDENGSVLICSVKSPFKEDEELGYQISFADAGDDMIVAEINMFLFNGIEKDRILGVNKLINRINPYIILGSLRFFEDSASVMFVHGEIFDGSLTASAVTALLGKILGIMENTAVNTGEYISRYLNGEELEQLLEEIDTEE